jgi:hypothetical protein
MVDTLLIMAVATDQRFAYSNVPYFITRLLHHTLAENRPAGFQQVAHGVTPHSITADVAPAMIAE